MKHSIIENTEIKVSRMGFGTGSLHHLFSSGDRQALLHAAFSAGITHYDTAPYYGYGLAEADLGRLIGKDRGNFTVTTKVGLYPWGAASGSAVGVWSRKGLGKLLPRVSLPVVNWTVGRARASLRDSLKRLRSDYVDFLFLHEPDAALLEIDEFTGWLMAERDDGNIRAWGLAGVAERVAPWLLAKNPIAAVIQTQDSVELGQADFVLDAGRSLQFTYGYLSAASTSGSIRSPEEVLHEALRRNQSGTILFSTRRIDHLADIARING